MEQNTYFLTVNGDNNSLENVNSRNDIQHYDIEKIISENKELRDYVMWAKNQIQIKDTLLKAFISRR